jgi:hypothetical protein
MRARGAASQLPTQIHLLTPHTQKHLLAPPPAHPAPTSQMVRSSAAVWSGSWIGATRCMKALPSLPSRHSMTPAEGSSMEAPRLNPVLKRTVYTELGGGTVGAAGVPAGWACSASACDGVRAVVVDLHVRSVRGVARNLAENGPCSSYPRYGWLCAVFHCQTLCHICLVRLHSPPHLRWNRGKQSCGRLPPPSLHRLLMLGNPASVLFAGHC